MDAKELNAMRDSILAEIKKMMLTTGQVTQYIGARYVPQFANPIEWDDQREYEPLTVVQYQGDSYTSRQFVPKGIRIADAHYWVLTGNYNAQIEQYRQEVQAFDARINENADNIELANKTIQAEADRAAAAEATKAPIDHSSTKSTYGIGTATEYGHVKLTDSIGSADASDGIAVTPKLISEINMRNRENEHLILIGDSYLQGVGAGGVNWGDELQKYMKCTVEKYANGGSGFWSNGTTAPFDGMAFNEMVVKIANEYDGDKNAVTGIIFEAGYNDAYNVTKGNNSYIMNTVKNARKAFPNAKIMVAFVYLPGWKPNYKERMGAAYNIYQYAAPQCADIFTTSINLNGVVQNISSDNIHPNATAQQYLGVLLAYNYISGQNYDYNTGSVTSPVYIDKNHNLVVKSFIHVLTQDISTTDDPDKEVIFDSSIVYSSYSENKYLYAINPAHKDGSGGWAKAILDFKPSGKLTIRNVSVDFKKGESIYIIPTMVPAFW